MFILGIFAIFVTAVSSQSIESGDYGKHFEERLMALEKTVKWQNTLVSQQRMLIKDLQETTVVQRQNILNLNEKLADQDNKCRETNDELEQLKRELHARDQWISSSIRTCMQSNTQAATTACANVDENEGRMKTDETSETILKTLYKSQETRKRFVLDTLETVAFEATMSGGTKLPHTHVNDRIVFESVSLNVGNSYHSGNGTFIAPIGGIFIFSTSVMMTTSSAQDPGMHIVIEKNGDEVAGAYAQHRDSYEHSSVTAAMSLKAGDTVFVSVERHNDISFYGDRLTSFMGFLLYPF